MYLGISIVFNTFKGTVSVISSNSLCADDNARFTTILVKPFSYH